MSPVFLFIYFIIIIIIFLGGGGGGGGGCGAIFCAMGHMHDIGSVAGPGVNR